MQDCPNETYVKGFCRKHYTRNYRHGSPSVALNNCGTGDTPEERFWSKVAITANPEKCWEWQGALTNLGYGNFGYRKRQWGAHRLAWFLFYGKEPEKFLLHSCDNPRCVNPRHLREGDHRENMGDMVARGRASGGEKNAQSKLTPEQVLQIRDLLRQGIPKTHIAARFNVNEKVIYNIALSKSWAHVGASDSEARKEARKGQ